MTSLALSELLGQPVFDAVGAKVGRVREVAMVPQEDSTHVALLVVRTESGDRLLATRQVQSINGGIRSSVPSTEWAAFSGSEGMLLMDRDLLDQQIIDVHGRKVVRVNDVELQPQARDEGGIQLKIGSVDVGARGPSGGC
jgi:magnesium transporter